MVLVPKWNDRLTWRGVTVTRRTRQMLSWVETKSGQRLEPAQGSYNVGGVSASAGTHDREAVDLRVRFYNDMQRTKVLNACKDAGFAAWYRQEVPGLWGPHIHLVPIEGDLSSGAAAQVASYDRHRSGLSGDAWDATYRPSPKVKWSWLLRRPVRRK